LHLCNATQIELNYVHQHMGLLYPLMTSRSADEFIFDIALAQGSLKFQVLDYLAIIIGTGYNKDVTPIAQLIDTTTELDNCISNGQLVKHMLSLSQSSSYFMYVLAHMFKKFPALLTMQYNFKKLRKSKKRIQRFTEKDIEKYFNFHNG
jgi:hypothetical protein